mmetsp:Transcript_9640/g.24883  ORF Transcript_9640/g.24883 Transcript_9640/m.24883 type:complete len:271 (+) Transcript_9640:2-814(+)
MHPHRRGTMNNLCLVATKPIRAHACKHRVLERPPHGSRDDAIEDGLGSARPRGGVEGRGLVADHALGVGLEVAADLQVQLLLLHLVWRFRLTVDLALELDDDALAQCRAGRRLHEGQLPLLRVTLARAKHHAVGWSASDLALLEVGHDDHALPDDGLRGIVRADARADLAGLPLTDVDHLDEQLVGVRVLLATHDLAHSEVDGRDVAGRARGDLGLGPSLGVALGLRRHPGHPLLQRRPPPSRERTAHGTQGGAGEQGCADGGGEGRLRL